MSANGDEPTERRFSGSLEPLAHTPSLTASPPPGLGEAAGDPLLPAAASRPTVNVAAAASVPANTAVVTPMTSTPAAAAWGADTQVDFVPADVESGGAGADAVVDDEAADLAGGDGGDMMVTSVGTREAEGEGDDDDMSDEAKAALWAQMMGDDGYDVGDGDEGDTPAPAPAPVVDTNPEQAYDGASDAGVDDMLAQAMQAAVVEQKVSRGEIEAHDAANHQYYTAREIEEYNAQVAAMDESARKWAKWEEEQGEQQYDQEAGYAAYGYEYDDYGDGFEFGNAAYYDEAAAQTGDGYGPEPACAGMCARDPRCLPLAPPWVCGCDTQRSEGERTGGNAKQAHGDHQRAPPRRREAGVPRLA